MAEINMSSLDVGEANKLSGASNYYMWSLKMRAILRSAGL
jgi:hypothetical protein